MIHQMTRGVRKNQPSKAEWDAVATMAEELTKLAEMRELMKLIGVSRQAINKWKERKSFPSEPNRVRALQALEHLRARQVGAAATKVTLDVVRRLPERPPIGLLSPALRGSEIAHARERGMGALVDALESPTGYLAELEICLWYNRREISSGKIALTTIAAAREGVLEKLGCAEWEAPKWWEELLALDRRIRTQLGLPVPPDEPPTKH